MDLLQIVCLPATWVALAILLVAYLYRMATSNFDVFSRQGIPGPKPKPVVGNMWGMWRDNIPRYDKAMVKKYGKTFGYFDGTTPNLYTIDDKLIKSVLVKDFDHFVNRREFQVHTKVFRMFLSLLQDQQWKDVRTSISPTFTSGKIKRMSGLIEDCTQKLSGKLEKSIQNNQGKFEVKKLVSSFAMDVIARCAFGMTIENIGEDGDPFTESASTVFNPPVNKQPPILIPFVFRKLGQILTPLFFITKEFKFFVSTLENVIRSRENSTQKYHDFLEITTEALAETVKTDSRGRTVPMWTKEETVEIVTAQSILFLLAGFETTGSTMACICYHLAKHPDIQERLYNEISEKMDQSGGKISNELVNSIHYLEQVVNETLRMHSPSVRLERKCSKDIQYGNITIKKDMVVTIPLHALHYCEEYFPEPERFDPDRWSPENKHKINPYTFLPFGTGPRNCIGMRFAMEEIKFAMCSIVKKYRLFAVDETPDILEADDGFNLAILLKSFKLGAELRCEAEEIDVVTSRPVLLP